MHRASRAYSAKFPRVLAPLGHRDRVLMRSARLVAGLNHAHLSIPAGWISITTFPESHGRPRRLRVGVRRGGSRRARWDAGGRLPGTPNAAGMTAYRS